MDILKTIVLFASIVLTLLCFADGVNHIINKERYMPIKEFALTSFMWTSFYMINCFF